MSTVLYYFSATGNSLTTARILSKQLSACEIIPIASLKDKEIIEVKEECIGFVFPIYYGDMPCIVRNVIKKMKFNQDSYIFSFATYRGHPGDIAKRLDMLLQESNYKLSLSIGIPMPGNSYLSTPEQIKDTLAHQEENIKKLVDKIKSRTIEDYSLLEEVAPSPVSKIWNMRGIKVDDNCIGCGNCTRVCPMDNIEIKGAQANIGDNCLTCLACFHWCPVECIYMSKEKDIKRREKYHHPEVRIKDIISQKIEK